MHFYWRNLQLTTVAQHSHACSQVLEQLVPKAVVRRWPHRPPQQRQRHAFRLAAELGPPPGVLRNRSKSPFDSASAISVAGDEHRPTLTRSTRQPRAAATPAIAFTTVVDKLQELL